MTTNTTQRDQIFNDVLDNVSINLGQILNQPLTADVVSSNDELENLAMQYGGLELRSSYVSARQYSHAKNYFQNKDIDENTAALMSMLVINVARFTNSSVQSVIVGLEERNVEFTREQLQVTNKIRKPSNQLLSFLQLDNCFGSYINNKTEMFCFEGDEIELASPPEILNVIPTFGPEAGGTTVTITGLNFDPLSQVTFEGIAAASITFVDPTELIVETPPGVGLAEVEVINPDNQSDIYVPVYQYSGWDTNPEEWFEFFDNDVIYSNDNFTVQEDGENRVFHAASHDSGQFAVRISTDGSTTAAGIMLYRQDLNPELGLDNNSWGIALNDSSSYSNEEALIHDANVNLVGDISAPNPPHEIMFEIDIDAGSVWFGVDGTWVDDPASDPPSFSFTPNYRVSLALLLNESGSSATLLRPNEFITPATSGFIAGWPDPLAFTYIPPPPIIDLIDPNSGPEAGGTLVSVQGQNFKNGAVIEFDNDVIPSTTFVNSGEITLTTIAGTGFDDVRITNPDGQFDEVDDGYEYISYTGWQFEFIFIPGTSVSFLNDNFTLERDQESGGQTIVFQHGTNKTSGRFDLRFTVNNTVLFNPAFVEPAVGFRATGTTTGSFIGSNSNAWAIWANDGGGLDERAYHSGIATSFGDILPSSGGEIMIAVDIDNGLMWAGADGVWANGGDPATGINPLYNNIPADIELITDMFYPGSVITLHTPDEFVTPVTAGFTAGWPD